MRMQTMMALALALPLLSVVSEAQVKSARELRPERLQLTHKVSDWMDAEVQDPRGKALGEVDYLTLGKVQDLIFNRDGKLWFLSVEHGGVAGVGATYVGVPSSVATVARRGDEAVFLVQMAPERFAKAPSFETENYLEVRNQEWLKLVNGFFRVEPDPRSLDSVPSMRASQLLGADLMGPKDEKIGSVEDLLMDEDRRLVFAIISAGGVLGIGDDHIAVPFSALGVASQPDLSAVGISLAMTREQLEAAPKVKAGDYRQLQDAGFVKLLYEYFPVVNP